MVSRAILIVLVSLVSLTCCIDNGLGLTPPMGWNSWNHFACDISEQTLKKTADKIVQLGLDKKGYVYVNVDDCWQIARNDTTKQIIEDKKKFPSGMAALAKYMHDKGLKFGLYSDAGYKTCQGRPGSYGYETIDAKTYAKWGVDYLKYDNCNSPNVTSKLRYYAMGKALNESGRAIFYSMCSWGTDKVWQWGNTIGNSWRTTGDITDKWSSFVSILQSQNGLQKYSQIGGWNDPDMLEVGNGGLSYNQSLTHFAFWCLLKAPLLIGCDLNNIDNDIAGILGNQQLIAINQDKLGIQGKRIKFVNGTIQKTQVWGGPLSGNRYALIFFNKGGFELKINVSLKDDLKLDYDSYTQRDPIRHVDIPESNKDIIENYVDYHGVEVRILTLKKKSNLVLQ